MKDIGTSFTDHILHYMIFSGMNWEQAVSKVEGDLHGTVPEEVKIIAKREMENIGRTQ